MNRGRDRADDFAGRVLAVHTRHRLKMGLIRRVRLPGVPGIDAYPVHLPVPQHFLLTDDGDIVFRLTGGGAGVAADAGIQVDRHRPGIPLVLDRRIKRFRRLRLLREPGIFTELLKRAAAHRIIRFNHLMLLGRGEGIMLTVGRSCSPAACHSPAIERSR